MKKNTQRAPVSVNTRRLGVTSAGHRTIDWTMFQRRLIDPNSLKNCKPSTGDWQQLVVFGSTLPLRRCKMISEWKQKKTESPQTKAKRKIYKYLFLKEIKKNPNKSYHLLERTASVLGCSHLSWGLQAVCPPCLQVIWTPVFVKLPDLHSALCRIFIQRSESSYCLSWGTRLYVNSSKA